MNEQANTTDDCRDANGMWPRRASQIVPELTETERTNLRANRGLDGTAKENCPDLESMICDIKQEVEAIANQRSMVIAANEASKCGTSDDPTYASMMSRIYRYADAMTQVMCAYDPFIATLLKSGRYPQILMGSVQDNGSTEPGCCPQVGYPQWIEPDEYPTEGSKKPVTSEGVYQAVKDALLGVWHVWEEYPEFDYFAQSLNSSTDTYNLTIQSTETPPSEGDTALVRYDGTDYNVLYTYTGGNWVKTKALTSADGLTNFATTHINKGQYESNAVYYFDEGGNNGSTWQVMDTDLGELEKKVEELQKIFDNSVLTQASSEKYVLTTRPNLTQANAVPCTNGKSTIVLITG